MAPPATAASQYGISIVHPEDEGLLFQRRLSRDASFIDISTHCDAIVHFIPVNKRPNRNRESVVRKALCWIDLS